jgi:hypothetical protein
MSKMDLQARLELLDQMLEYSSEKLKDLRDEDKYCFYLGEKKRLALVFADCGKNCPLCPHNLYWAEYGITKNGKKKWNGQKRYRIGRVPIAVRRKLSETNRRKLEQVEQKIKKLMGVRAKLVKGKRTISGVLSRLPSWDDLQIN